MTPRIAVIVPVYNTEKYLNRCVDSLLEQTLSDIQIILVDDGSTDKSGKICDQYAERDKRVIVIHKENAGQGLARNDGMEAATADYICFLDSDDYYEKKTCEILVNTMDKSGSDIVSYGYRMDDPKGNMVKCPKIRDNVYPGPSGIHRFILHYFGDDPLDDELRGISSCMSVFKRSIIMENNVRFPSEREVSSEDTAFCLEYMKHAKKAETIGDVLYHYCQNEGSFSQGYKPDRLRLMKAHINMLFDYSDDYENYNEVKERIAMTAWVNLIAYMKQVCRKFDREATIEAMKEAAEDPDISDALDELPADELPAKQRLLYNFIKDERYLPAYFLVAVRAKSRM